jgi:hypothetical protein
MPSPDTPPRFQTALRLTAFGARASFTFTLALVAADLASQMAAPDARPLWFGLAGGTAALGFWRMWGWILRRIGIE